MQLRKICLFAGLSLCLASLFGCSRESSIKENANLKNNHSVVFAFNEPIEDEEAFADSIANLANPDSVLAFDTLTVTINDPVYFVGFLRYNSEKIYRYAWRFTSELDSEDSVELLKYGFKVSTKDKAEIDTTVSGANGSVQSWSFPKESFYKALFIAVDGNNARDTAGIRQYIRVINTSPILEVPHDTIWTRSKGFLENPKDSVGQVSFPIAARDSFGTIVSLKIDPDASGKTKPQKWNFEPAGGDTLIVTIDYNEKYIDSLGNQKIYVIAIDDDDNETTDSVIIHYNRPPTIELLQPMDGSKFSNKERFAFYYKAEDSDNPASLRYFIRAAKSRDNSGKPPVLTDNDLIAEGIKEKSFEAVTASGKNLINLAGRIYWDVWVTDGYDTVFAEHVKDGKTTRPWTFFLGDPDKTTGEMYGYAKYEGWRHHQGIRITLKDSVGNSYYGSTNDKGYYSIDVPPGSYRMWANDTTSYRFASDSLSYQHVETGDNVLLNPVTLKDTSNPIIYFTDKVDTINVRDYQIAGKLYDFGSQVESATAWFDNKETELSYLSTNSFALNLENLTDGVHKFALTVKDSAGLVSDTLKYSFVVDATSINLNVDGKTSKMVNTAQKLTFTAKILNASPMPDSVSWETNIKDAKVFKSAVVDSVATLVLSKDMLPDTIAAALLYEMVVKTKDGNSSNKVRFGYYSDGPSIYFEYPSNDTVITMNDSIRFNLEVFANNADPTNETKTIVWTCSGTGLEKCPAEGTTEGAVAWTKTGDQKLAVTITNADGKKASDTLRVKVISDPPTIRLSSTDITGKHKINSTVSVEVSASDKFGTINKVTWGCSNGKVNFDFDTTFTTPQKSFSNMSFNVLLPGTATDNYKCVFKAIDDDGESASDSLTFVAVQDLPYVSLNTKQLEVTIKDQVPFQFVAKDTLGRIVKYEYACDSVKKNLKDEWIEFNSSNMTLTMPPKACTWYCAIRVTDDDDNKTSDTATYTVLLDPPTVQVLGDYTVTIKDTVGLDAMAYDKMGKIVQYEWGCGSHESDNIGFTYKSSNSPSYNAVMPSTAQDDYLCIIRVTDDDGNTAKDTTHINIILAPPSISVTNKSAIVREGYNIVLNASASDYPDYPGYIDKREWSCGTPSDIDNNWKTVSQYDTVWKAPAASVLFYCVARATDDDGNIATDTMTITFSTDIPLIAVQDEEIYVLPGEKFEMNASVNNVWQGISWFTWECIDASSGKSLEPKVTKYDYYKNGSSFYDFRDEEFSAKGKDLKCIVTAEESSTKATFSDTMLVRILNNPPQGVITAADTVYPWSGDESVSDEALYFYSDEWGGMNSKLGTIGDEDEQQFWWSFSNVDGNFYQGNSDGTLDTTIEQFNSAFIRSTRESTASGSGALTICLDYRDSTTDVPTLAFYTRHRAEETCRKVYFSKAWRNLATDTVLETAKFSTAPALATIDKKPVVAYLTSNTQVTTSYYNGSEWKKLSTSSISATDSITSLTLASTGSDLILAVLASDKSLNIYKSAGGTSAWAHLGSAIENASSVAITSNPSSGEPVITYIETTTKFPVLIHWNGSAWETEDVPTMQTGKSYTTSNCKTTTSGRRKVTTCDTTYTYNYMKVREMQSKFLSSGDLAIIYVDTTSKYQAYYVLFNSSYTVLKKDEKIAQNVNGISLAIDGSDIYMGYLNRDTEKYGPYVHKGTVGSNSISWTTSGAFGQSLHEGQLAYHISLAASSGKLFAIIDDNGRTSLAQSHAYYLDGSKWKHYGENELPYFKNNFYTKHNYFLRGAVPQIAISSEGKVYISMLAWENAGGSGKNFGPIIMKYVADSWTVH